MSVVNISICWLSDWFLCYIILYFVAFVYVRRSRLVLLRRCRPSAGMCWQVTESAESGENCWQECFMSYFWCNVVFCFLNSDYWVTNIVDIYISIFVESLRIKTWSMVGMMLWTVITEVWYYIPQPSLTPTVFPSLKKNSLHFQ